MKQKLNPFLLFFFLLPGFATTAKAQTTDLDCSKLDMSNVLNFFNEGLPLQVTGFFSNLKRLEDCVVKGVYEEKESVGLIDRQIGLITTGENVLEYFLGSGLVQQLKAEKYYNDVVAAYASLIVYAKTIRVRAKENTEEKTKNMVESRNKSWALLTVVNYLTTEEK